MYIGILIDLYCLTIRPIAASGAGARQAGERGQRLSFFTRYYKLQIIFVENA